MFSRLFARRRRRISLEAQRRRLLRPQVERLEDRQLLATVNWIGGSGDWNTAANWLDATTLTNHVPVAGDDAVIDVAAAVTVTHSSGTHTVQSLTINESFTLSGGTLVVTGNLVQQNANTFTMTGGTLRSATVVGGGGAVLVASGTNGKTFDGVTLGGTVGGVPLPATLQVDARIGVMGGLTFANGSLVDLGSFLDINGDQTVGGDGTIRFRSRGGGGGVQITSFNHTIFGPGLTIDRADTTTTDIFMNGGSITNHATIRANAGGKIRLTGNPTFTNADDGVLAADGGTLDLLSDWSNAGQIVVNNSTINLGGTFTTAGLGTFTRTGGTINLVGVLDNTGDIFTLDAVTGSWNLGPSSLGTLRGGSLVTSGGAALMASGGTLDGVTLGATVAGVPVSANVQTSNHFTVTGGLTFTNGSVVELNNFSLTLSGSQLVGGDGEIRLRGGGGGITIFSQVTFEPGLTIHRADTGFSNGLNIGASGQVTNQATIRADQGGITVGGGGVFTNAANGILEATGGTLAVTRMTNHGAVNVSSGTLNLGNGNTTWSPTASLNHTGGVVNVSGTLTSTGAIATAANVTLTGTIIGGTFSTAGTGKLLLNGGTLQGVTVAGVVEVQSNSFVKGGLRLIGGQLIVNSGRKLTFQSSNQELTGFGTVKFAGTGGALEVEASRRLTIGASVIIVATTGSNSLVATASGASGVNYATRSTAAGATIALVGNWTDSGAAITPNPANADGGPITRNVPTSGNISVAGEMDNWTYFARTGQALSILLNPANGVSPALGFAQLQILDPANNVIGTAAGSVNGQSLQLVDFTFPAAGTYTIRVNASPVLPTAIGNYLLLVYEATLDTRPLVLNQQVTGLLESHASTDRWTFSANANQQVQLHLLGAASPGIRFQLTGPNGFIGFIDLNEDSGLVNLPTTGSYVLQAAGNLTGFGAYTFRLDATNQTALTLGTTYNGSLPSSGFVQLFTLAVTQSQSLLIHFDDANATDRTEVYARFGAPPTRQTFDARFDANGADHRVAVPFAAPGTWYILVYAERVSSVSNFTLLVESPLIATFGMTPNYGGVGERSRVTITGLGFVPGMQFELVPVIGGATIPSQQLSIDSTTQATAVFDLAGAIEGNYDIRATLPTGPSISLLGAFQVGALAGGELKTRLVLPSALGRHSIATLYVDYENIGTAPMSAPIIIVQSGDLDNSDLPLLTLDQSRVTQGFFTSAIPDGFANSVQIYASGAVPGVLQPGERIRVPVYYAGLQQPWDFSDDRIELELRIHTAEDPAAIDWPALEAESRPDWIAADVWPAVFGNLQFQIGSTWGAYVRMLEDNAFYLDRLGEHVSSVDQLYGFELQQALGLDAQGTIAEAVDASATSPGLALTFSRSFGTTISQRYRPGPFGRGWNVSWQQFAEPLADGTVIVHDAQRRFQPDSRRANTYFSQTGDTGTLRKVTGGHFELTETSGLVTRFLADGRLDLVREAHGNTITAGYTNNLLTSLSHSSGRTLTITYNAAGHIASITDPFGRSTIFGYDPTSNLLLSATNQAGTTSYTYNTGNGAAREYALTSITDPSGVTQSFEYDMQGRLTATFFGTNVGRTSYAYDSAGSVTITDAANAASKFFFDQNRQVARVEESTGYYIRTQFDANLRPVKQVDAQGASQTATWTATGALRSLTDELGATTTFAPGGPFNQPLSFSDARGSTTRYTFNVAGDLTATTYADNSVEQVAYDAQGNSDVLTNRRGQSNDLTVNAAGQVIHESRSDGTSADYTYDASGRLRTATDARGTTTLSYDAADRLTQVEYPADRWIQYAYDAAGRRTRLEDHSGFVVQYVYDLAGRLERLLDAANSLIVRYTYDAAERLSREDKGNGTFTDYGYDAAGRVVSITHRAPNNSINAAFGYTYDAADRQVTAATPDGTWSYTYDLTDQLIRAVFASNNSSISNQDLNYEYDALGNRVRTVLNGVTTNYSANNLNQYATAGSTSLSFDLDGNLTQEFGPVGTKIYTYDLQNRLTRIQTPQGVWQYEYDVFGNRVAVIANGQRTEYLIDPTGLGDVLAEYTGAGLVGTHYTQGLGLASRVDASGTASYYNFDSLGSTVQLTGPSGAIQNSYSYQPFGEVLYTTGAAANPFTFVGAAGVMNDGNGLYFMRARFYGSDHGRFVQQDPLNLGGDDVNLYRYVANSPVDQIDASGLKRGGGGRRGGGFVVTFGPAIIEPTYDVWIGPAVIEDPCPPDPNIPTPCNMVPAPPPPPPPPGPPSPPCKSWLQCPPPPPVPMAVDPNEKLGALGFGPNDYIPADSVIPYRINFENLGPGSVPVPAQPATAPAQRVEVTDQLSANLDWNTLQFTEFGFGDTIVTVPDGRANHFETVSMTYNNQTFDVQVELTFDSATGLVSAVFQSLDPGTALPPDVLTGFLPPEDGTGIGKAHVSFVIQPKSGLMSGTQLRNIGLIRFDGQTIIATNQIDPQNPAAGTDPNKEALNTIDAGTPTSSVNPLPVTQSSANFLVTWSGTDDAGGAGIGGYDIYVSDNGGAFTPWLTGTVQLSASYTGQNGHTYGFFSVAADNVGHREAAPTSADASTMVISNSPPTLASVSLAPTTAFEISTLTATPVGSADADGDAITYSYQWFVNGSPIAPATSTLTGAHFNKGNTVSARVTPNDGTDNGPPVDSNTVTISNSPPTLASVSLTPTTAFETSTLSATPAGGMDADGDPITYSYQWFVNDSPIAPTTSTLTGAHFNKGNTVSVRVTPNDGTDDGPPVDSNTVTISNSPPTLASVSLTPTTAFETSTLSATPAGGMDADGDPITFSYQWFVNDSPIAPTTSTLNGTYFDKGNTVSVRVTPNDGTDNGPPVNSNTVTISNSPPTLASVSLPAALRPGLDAAAIVTASLGGGKLDAWIDFNHNGVFELGLPEQIATSLPLAAGASTVTFFVPASASGGTTLARFRLSPAGGLLPTGEGSDVEVADYAVVVTPLATGCSIVADPVRAPAVDLLLCVGTNGRDRIEFLRGSAAGKVRVLLNGRFTTEFTPGRLAALGLGGKDELVVSNKLNLPAEFNGGPSNDVLRGSSGDDVFRGGDGKDRLVGNGGNDVLFGGNDDDKLEAGSGFDVLLGEGGNDELVAQDDHDVLIGGAGRDVLKGGKRPSLLIGGTTDFDAKLDALRAIRNEWAAGDPIADRVAHLIGAMPGGLNGAVRLKRDGLTVVGPGTVHNDGLKDTLKGSSAIDWFFAFALDELSLSGGDLVNHALV